MSKCYDLKCLQKYRNNRFIYERKSVYEENVFNYETIINETIKFVNCLHKCGIESNVGIAIDLKEHSATSCVLLLGTLNHDCYFFCLDLEELKDNNYLSLSGIKYMISAKAVKSDIIHHQIKEIIIFDDTFYLMVLKTPNSHFKNINLCYTIATSGSTGLPKMVHVPYECIQPNIKSLSCLLNIQVEDLIFLGTPPTFDPFIVEFFMALANGAGLLITSKEIRLQSDNLVKVLFPDHNTTMKGVTIYQTTPSIFRLFGKHNINNMLNGNSSLRCLILGGEEFPPLYELVSWLPSDFTTCNKRIFNIYGITEVSCWSSIFEFIPGEYTCQGEYIPIGKPLDDLTYFRIVDEFGNVLPNNGCKGEFEIGSYIRRCFIPQYDQNTKILESSDIIYRKTGDLVERDELGNIFYLGRTNNIVKRFGKFICLDSLGKKIERLLFNKALPFKVVTLWLKNNMKLIIYLVSVHVVTSEEKQFIQSLLQHNLENHEHPDEIFYSKKPLPLNKNGKVNHYKILEEILESKEYNSPIIMFKNFLRNILGLNIDATETAFIATTYDKKHIKVVSNISFIEAGGTSFQALSLATELAENMEIPGEKRKIIEMLLDSKVTINEILSFLHTRICLNKTRNDIIFKLPINNLSFSFKLMWRRNLKKCIDASPTLYREDIVAIGSHSHLLLVLDTKTGQEISSLELPDRIECPVVFVSSELAFVGCYDGFLYGFNFKKGTITSKLNVKGMIKAKPLVINNIVIVASYAEKYNVVAYDIQSLTLKWNLKLGSKAIFSSPLQICEESVLLCSLDGSYSLIDIQAGSIKWMKKFDSPIFSTAAKIRTTTEIFLVLAEVNGCISICKAENGVKVTSFQAEGNIFSGITLYQQGLDNNVLIIFGCYDKYIYCLNFEFTREKLSLKWKYLLNSPIYSTPIIISNYILCCSTQGMMVLLDVDKAELLASHDLKAEVFSTPNSLKNKFIYLGSRDNNLYAFELVQ